jgi:hypothetical protein
MLFNKFANTTLCQHPRFNNQPCGQPALKGQKFCRFHDSSHRSQPDYSIPMVEDALSLQFAIMQVIRALHDRVIDSKTASITLYALQIAGGNLKRLLADRQSPAEDPEREQSLAELLLKALQIPETPEELAAELSAQEYERNQAPAVYPPIGAPRDYSVPPPPWPPDSAATITKTSVSNK